MIKEMMQGGVESEPAIPEESAAQAEQADQKTQSPDERLVAHLESISDKKLEQLISESELVNGGWNGLIFRMPEKLLAEQMGADFEGTAKVIKTLKVYQAGAGKREYEMQKTAYDLVQNSPDAESMAQVPKPIWFHTIKVNDAMREELNRRGMSLTGNEAEFIVMDYVPGTDLATLFYKWVIEHQDTSVHHPIRPRNPNSFDETQSAAAQILGCVEPLPDWMTPGDIAVVSAAARRENREKLYTLLKRTGFNLDPEIIEQIARTIRLLHANRIYHNDPHERNFMISPAVAGGKNKAGSKAQVSIIDYGYAGKRRDGSLDDEYIVYSLRELISAEAGSDVDELQESLITREQLLFKNDRWQKEYQALTQAIEARGESALTSAFQLMRGRASEDTLDRFFVTFRKLIDDSVIDRTQALAFLDHQLSVKSTLPMPVWMFNKTKRYRKLIEEER
jgi:hypothetical protein